MTCNSSKRSSCFFAMTLADDSLMKVWLNKLREADISGLSLNMLEELTNNSFYLAGFWHVVLVQVFD